MTFDCVFKTDVIASTYVVDHGPKEMRGFEAGFLGDGCPFIIELLRTGRLSVAISENGENMHHRTFLFWEMN